MEGFHFIIAGGALNSHELYSVHRSDMPNPLLNLVVLRSSNISRAADFYSRLGLQFTKHRHGTGPEHFSAELPGCVFELYPQTENAPPTSGARVGFRVASIEETIRAVADYPDAIVSPPNDSEWGRRAVLADPDGHRVELLESPKPVT